MSNIDAELDKETALFNPKSMVMRESGLTMAQDLFCIFFVNTGNEKKAFVQAFPDREPTVDEISAMFNNSAVLARINLLYNRRVRLLEADVAVDITRLYQELEAARVLAMDNGQASAAISATMGKAKIAGLIVDKQQITVKKVTDLTDEELKFLLEGDYQDITPKAIENGAI